MSKYVGTWVYDSTVGLEDTVKHLRLDVRDDKNIGWGTAVGLGWTPQLRICKAGDTATVGSMTGSWETNATDPESAALFQVGNESTISFEPGTTTLVPSAAGDSISYEAILVMVDAGGTHVGVQGADGQSEVFSFFVQRYP